MTATEAKKVHTNDGNTFVVFNRFLKKCLSHREYNGYAWSPNPGDAWTFSRNEHAARARMRDVINEEYLFNENVAGELMVITRQEARRITGYVLKEA